MNHNEIINNLTLAAIEEMQLKNAKSSLKRDEYNKFITDTVIDTYLKISYAVVNGKKKEE